MVEKSVDVGLENGLDANVIAVLVQRACKHSATVHLQIDTKKVNAKSIMGMMNMCVSKGSPITIICDGEDEEAAIADIEAYITTGK